MNAFGFGTSKPAYSTMPVRASNRARFMSRRGSSIMPVRSPSRIIIPAGRAQADSYSSHIAYAPEHVDKPEFWSREGSYYNTLEGLGDGFTYSDPYAMATAQPDYQTADTSASSATPPSIWDNLFNTISQKVLPAVIQYKQSKQVADINTQRISQGLPPLTAAQSASMSPAATVNVGLSPATQNMLMIGGAAAIGAFFLFGKKRR